jgi:hypothetical protein
MGKKEFGTIDGVWRCPHCGTMGAFSDLPRGWTWLAGSPHYYECRRYGVIGRTLPVMDHPIGFSESMVKALLCGHKTETRRLIEHKDTYANVQVGDVFWVRETSSVTYVGGEFPNHHVRLYKADNPAPLIDADDNPVKFKWTSGRFLPRKGARIWLKVTANSKGWLASDFSDSVAFAEGITPIARKLFTNWLTEKSGQYKTFSDPQAAFMDLWDSIHDKPGTRFGDDPRIRRLQFRRLLPLSHRPMSYYGLQGPRS